MICSYEKKQIGECKGKTAFGHDLWKNNRARKNKYAKSMFRKNMTKTFAHIMNSWKY